jgi:anti-sigma regulatory factor (Ser/Thr protein kinase)
LPFFYWNYNKEAGKNIAYTQTLGEILFKIFMENEKHFYPEYKEAEPKSYEVYFDDEHFGDTEKPIDTDALVGKMHTWWEQICTENSIDHDDKIYGEIHYHLMELGKNALEHGDGGMINVIFEPDKITVIVSDKGQGFEDMGDVEYSSSSQYGHGLYEVRRYADEFSIESGGKKYGKVKSKRKLVDMGASDITTGSKITFIKNFE